MFESTETKSIGTLQAEIEAALNRLRAIELPADLEPLRVLAAPRGWKARVSLRRLSGDRRIRSDADSSYWDRSGGDCEASVYYEPAEGEGGEIALAEGSASGGSDPVISPALHDVVLALDAAEREPRFREFVGIKLFRDQFLPGRGGDWSFEPQARHEVLREAINQGIILRSSVANPKSPQYPVTAIRLNREHPIGKAVLGGTVEQRAAFPAPIAVRGGPLSATVLSERR